jgi:hypothetical protein
MIVYRMMCVFKRLQVWCRSNYHWPSQLNRSLVGIKYDSVIAYIMFITIMSRLSFAKLIVLGLDPDILVWEQSYFCGTNDDEELHYALEQFIRQSFFIPSKPVVAYSFSSTPNWCVIC